MEPPPLSGRRFRFTIRTSFYNRPAIPRRKSERIPTRGPIAGRREYVVVLSSVGLRPAENASTACGGTMQPSAWSGCGLPLSGRSRRANLLQSLVLAESECESVGNILNVYPKASRTSDWAFPARSGFTTFCHRKVAPKVSAGHLRRDRTEVLTERAQKTALFCTPAPGARAAAVTASAIFAVRSRRSEVCQNTIRKIRSSVKTRRAAARSRPMRRAASSRHRRPTHPPPAAD